MAVLIHTTHTHEFSAKKTINLCLFPYYLPYIYTMAISVVEFPREGYKFRKFFLLKINIPKGNKSILRMGVVASCQKLGIILENKVI